MNENTRKQVYTIALMGILVAMEILLARLFSIRTPIVTIGFGFIPVSLAAMMFGPVRGGVVGALGDFLGALLFPIGPYFPGFTLTAFLTGMIFGLFLRERPLRFTKVLIAVLLVNVVCSLCVDTLWLYMITGKGVLALLPARLIKCAVMIPVHTLVIQLVSRNVGNRLLTRFHLA